MNYDKWWNGMLSEYVSLSHSVWYIFFGLGLVGPKHNIIPWIYQVIHFICIYLTISFGRLAFKGIAIALSATGLEKFASIRLDSEANLTRAQIEWIQTEEVFAEAQLLTKQQRPIGVIPVTCLKIKDSIIWIIVYYISLLAGFIVSMTK